MPRACACLSTCRPARPLDVLAVGLNSIDLLAVVRWPSGRRRQGRDARVRPAAGRAVGVGRSRAGAARLRACATSVGSATTTSAGSGLESLRGEGVDVAGSSPCPARPASSRSSSSIATPGTRTVIWHRHPGLAMSPDDVPPDAVADARVVLRRLPGTSGRGRGRRRARRAGARTVVDVERVRPGIDALLRPSTSSSPPTAFPAAYTGPAVARRGAGGAAGRDCGAAVVCVTLGAEGSLARRRRPRVPHPGLRRAGRRHDRGRRRLPGRVHRRMAGRRRRGRTGGRCCAGPTRWRRSSAGAWGAHGQPDPGGGASALLAQAM